MIDKLFSSMHELLDYIIEHYSEADEKQQEQYCCAVGQIKESNDGILDQYVALEEKLSYFFELYRDVEDQKHQDVVEQADDACNDHADMIEKDIPLDELMAAAEAVEAGLLFSSESLKGLHKRTGISSSLLNGQKQGVEVSPNSKDSLYSAAEKASCNECDLFVSPEHELALEYAQGYYKLFMFAEAAHILQNIITEKPECNIARMFYGMSLMHLRNWNEAQRQFQLMTVLSDFPKWLALSYNALGCIHAIKLNLNQAVLLFKKAYGLYPKFEDPLKNMQNCMESPQQLSLYFGSTELCCM